MVFWWTGTSHLFRNTGVSTLYNYGRDHRVSSSWKQTSVQGFCRTMQQLDSRGTNWYCELRGSDRETDVCCSVFQAFENLHEQVLSGVIDTWTYINRPGSGIRDITFSSHHYTGRNDSRLEVPYETVLYNFNNTGTKLVIRSCWYKSKLMIQKRLQYNAARNNGMLKRESLNPRDLTWILDINGVGPIMDWGYSRYMSVEFCDAAQRQDCSTLRSTGWWATLMDRSMLTSLSHSTTLLLDPPTHGKLSFANWKEESAFSEGTWMDRTFHVTNRRCWSITVPSLHI